MFAAARASRRKRERAPRFCATFLSMTFSATTECKTVSCARYVMAIAPEPSSTGNPSVAVSTSKWAYRSDPGVSRPRAAGLSGCSPSARKVRLIRHRRHSPFGPHCVNGRPQVAQVVAVSLCPFPFPRPTLKSFMWREARVRP